MADNALILVVDDEFANRDILQTRLEANGYRVITAENGKEAVEKTRREIPDLILMDINMPEMDGLEACRNIRQDSSLPFIPIILATALSDSQDVVKGLDAGAEEYITKPLDHTALMARVRSMLRVKALQEKVQAQAEELERWNTELEDRVAVQMTRLQHLNQLKRFFSPHLAELLSGEEGQRQLESHKRDITVVFCDLRGFTAFADRHTPEQVKTILDEYHHVAGTLISKYEGTLERFAGDGFMVYFNDPIPVDNHTEKALFMAIDMRKDLQLLCLNWKQKGYDLGFGIGIDTGVATLGMVGFEERIDYAAIGSVCNRASRLCDIAADGQILITEGTNNGSQARLKVEPLGTQVLKGFATPLPIYNVLGFSD